MELKELVFDECKENLSKYIQIWLGLITTYFSLIGMIMEGVNERD